MKNDLVFKNACINGALKTIIINDGKISDILKNGIDGIDLKGKRVIPGLIDIHTHGIMNVDTMDADFSFLCGRYASVGTTSFLPTTMTMPLSDIQRVCNAKTDFCGANILGIHLEGPYISENKKGAQSAENIRKPDISEFSSFKNVKMITVAPEISGALAFIEKASKTAVVSIGHTECTAETAQAAINVGANCLTHTFNAMPPLLHREAGPIGAAVESGIYAQIICDGFHVSRQAFLAAYKMFGPDRLILISDSIRCAKCEDGVYNCGGLEVFLKDGRAKLKDGTIAGSTSTLLECVAAAISFGVPERDAVKMATETPARLLGVKKGMLKKGYDADLLVLNDDFSIEKVIIGGKEW